MLFASVFSLDNENLPTLKITILRSEIGLEYFLKVRYSILVDLL